jgi:hypothetical protein
MQIYLIKDISGSMSVLGKEIIAENAIQSLIKLKEFDAAYSGVEFVNQDWHGSFQVLIDIFKTKNIERALVFTDGYFASLKELSYFVNILKSENKRCIFVYCGSDANLSRYGYEAEDLISALHEVCGQYEIQA